MARCVALLAALVLLAGTAPASAAPPSPAGGTLLYQKTTKYIFEDEEIPVELAGVDTGWVESRSGVRFDTLVKPRADFMPEMIKSCEDL